MTPIDYILDTLNRQRVVANRVMYVAFHYTLIKQHYKNTF